MSDFFILDFSSSVWNRFSKTQSGCLSFTLKWNRLWIQGFTLLEWIRRICHFRDDFQWYQQKEPEKSIKNCSAKLLLVSPMLTHNPAVVVWQRSVAVSTSPSRWLVLLGGLWGLGRTQTNLQSPVRKERSCRDVSAVHADDVMTLCVPLLQTPFTLTLRLWDIFILEGERLLTAMSYTILKIHKSKDVKTTNSSFFCLFMPPTLSGFIILFIISLK